MSGECGLERRLRRHFILTAVNSHFLLTQAEGEKDLSVAQLADALQVILERRIEGLMNHDQLLMILY